MEIKETTKQIFSVTMSYILGLLDCLKLMLKITWPFIFIMIFGTFIVLALQGNTIFMHGFMGIPAHIQPANQETIGTVVFLILFSIGIIGIESYIFDH